MKKLILMIMLLAPMLLAAQGAMKIDYRTITSYDTFSISTIDTAWTVPVTANYTGTFQLYYTKLTGTLDCIIKMQGSVDGTNYFDLNMASVTPADTVGVAVFHLTYGTGSDYEYLRLLFDRNSVTGGQLVPDIRLNKRK